MNRFLGAALSSIVLVAAVGFAALGRGQDKPIEKKSLYDRLGGVYPIAVVVDDFIERVLVDDVINTNPVVKAARDRVPKAGLKFQVTALVCEVTGGPYKYHGRTMVESHKHLGINGKEWEAMVADFKASLDKYKVPAAEQEELFAIIGTTKKDIVTK